MSRKYHTLRLGDSQYRLRLTIRGQNNLRDRFQEDTIQTVLGGCHGQPSDGGAAGGSAELGGQ